MEGKRQATATAAAAGFGGGSSPSRTGAGNQAPSEERNRGGSGNNSSLDHLFGPRDSGYGYGYGSGSGSFGSIFSPPSAVLGSNSRAHDSGNPTGYRKHGIQASQSCSKVDGSGKTKGGGMYPQHETAEPCYLSSSIYYGGQENYSPRTSRTTTESHQMLKKEDGDGESGSMNSDSASRGNWWQGSLYY